MSSPASSSSEPCAQIASHTDPFCTPSNKGFHAKGLYRELKDNRREFRLIKLLPENGEAPVECELIQNLNLTEQQGTFTALSYCAGDPKNTRKIIVNEHTFHVFANLEHALKEVQHYWGRHYPGKDCLLWVDQICINQTDTAERSHQVGFMKDIYSSAKEVLVCLATKKCNGRGLEWLSKLVQSSSCRKTRKQLLSTFDDFEWMEIWLALFGVLLSPWWKRAWIFQEFIAASDAVFLYGRSSITWFDLWSALFLRCSTNILVPGDKHVIKLIRTKLLDTTASRKLDKSLCRITRSPHTVQVMRSILESKRNWHGPADFCRLLEHSQICKASDKRDKVYAFLGLISPGYGIVPDYCSTNTITRVLTETAKSIIRFDDNLEILSYVDTSPRSPSDPLPSWVPDWSSDSLPSWVLDWSSEEVSIRLSTLLNESGDDLKPGALFSRWTAVNPPFLKADLSSKELNVLISRRRNANAEFIEVDGGGTILKVMGIQVDEHVLSMASKMATGRSGAYQISNQRLVEAYTKVKDQAPNSYQLWIVYGATAPLILQRERDHYRVGELRFGNLRILDSMRRERMVWHDLIDLEESAKLSKSGKPKKQQICIH